MLQAKACQLNQKHLSPIEDGISGATGEHPPKLHMPASLYLDGSRLNAGSIPVVLLPPVNGATAVR
jgi:hypothetical protein